MEIGKEVITTLKIFINHNFVKHPNSMIWMVCMLTAHNWQKWKRVLMICPCRKIYGIEAFGLKKMQIYLKNYDFCENVKFGAISCKFDILTITA